MRIVFAALVFLYPGLLIAEPYYVQSHKYLHKDKKFVVTLYADPCTRFEYAAKEKGVPSYKYKVAGLKAATILYKGGETWYGCWIDHGQFSETVYIEWFGENGLGWDKKLFTNF